MMIGWLVLVLLVIGAVWLAVGYSRRPTPDGQASARRILGERYARGELDTEEYHRRLDALR
ncbi:SHOCT domain-containing protein [Micromonospora globbae]|uniref:SHOCT domain-containing protein n=1 Tax=Micromonospora globbae TaxID=1894969 RepID=UPI003794B9FA